MNDMERSQELFEALEKLEAGFPEVELQEEAALDDPENKDLITKLAVGMHLFGSNDLRVKALQASVEALKLPPPNKNGPALAI